MEENKNIETEKMTNEEFQSVLEEEMKKQFENVRMAGMLAGAKGICGVVLQYINNFNTTPGKKTANDYKRLTKKIAEFCSVSLGKKVDE